MLARNVDLVSLATSATSRRLLASVAVQVICSKISEAEAAVSVNEKNLLVMHMHVQMRLDELRGPPNPWLTVT